MSKKVKGFKKNSTTLNFNFSPADELVFHKIIALRKEVDNSPLIKANPIVVSIFMNPEEFFDKILSTLETSSLKIILRFTVYAVIRKIYASNLNIVEDIKSVKPSISLKRLTDTTENYLNYSLSLIDEALKDGNDAIIDLFNSKALGEKSYKSFIQHHNNSLKAWEIDREDISEALAIIRKARDL